MKYFYSYKIIRPGLRQVYAEGYGLMQIDNQKIDISTMKAVAAVAMKDVKDSRIEDDIPEDAVVNFVAFNPLP